MKQIESSFMSAAVPNLYLLCSTLKTWSCNDANFVVTGAASDDKVGIMTTLDFHVISYTNMTYIYNLKTRLKWSPLNIRASFINTINFNPCMGMWLTPLQ